MPFSRSYQCSFPPGPQPGVVDKGEGMESLNDSQKRVGEFRRQVNNDRVELGCCVLLKTPSHVSIPRMARWPKTPCYWKGLLAQSACAR